MYSPEYVQVAYNENAMHQHQCKFGNGMDAADEPPPELPFHYSMMMP